MSKRCSNCGHENRDVATFCGNCGSKLIANDMANNFTAEGSTGSANNNGTTYKGTGTGSNDAGSLCCGVLIVLFIIILIMSMG